MAPALAVALTVVGAVGSSDGVATFDAADAGPIPVALVARTRKVYGGAVGEICHWQVEDGGCGEQSCRLGLLVTVYPVIDEPPSVLGAVQLTVAYPLWATALTVEGALA